MTPQDFVAQWRNVSAKERSAYQSHFIDVCRLVGHPTPMEADRSGQTFAFEFGAEKTEGGQGFADVFLPDRFAWEYKGPHANLDKAYKQLLQYRESLRNPPLLIVSDLASIEIHTNFTNSVKKVYTLSLDDLLTPDGLKTLRAAFFDPESLKAAQTVEDVTQDVAGEFARLAEQLRKWKVEPERAAHFLIRLLFCLFAEDVGLLPNKLFSRLVEHGRRNPRVFHQQLRQLFRAMAEGGPFGAEIVPHFNGGLFDDDAIIELDSDALDMLARVAKQDWGSIEPSIFGTLFERSLDPGKRAQLGAQYTDRSDILLVVEPVLMQPLRRRWATVKAEVEELMAKAKSIKVMPQDTRTRTSRDNLIKQIQRKLRSFSDELANTKVLDPACGSGNFLYVALRLLLDLEKEVLAYPLGLGDAQRTVPTPRVSPVQLYGIEVDPYAHELAQATVWIGYLQWMIGNGFGWHEPILAPLHNIRHMDAILDIPPGDLPVTEPEWPEADVIVGNPPFLGSRKMRPSLGDEYCDNLIRVYGDEINGLPDLVCYWFEKARRQTRAGKAKRVGLLATQAIRGGTNRQVLEKIKLNGNIFWAWSDREWILDGAVVHVSMVGFDSGEETEIVLDGSMAASINADLTSVVDTSVATELEENSEISFQGVVLRGRFNISKAEAQKMLSQSGNPNGRPNSDVIRPRRTGEDVVSKLTDEYVIDFGVAMPIEEAAKYETPFEYLKKDVYPMRQKANQVTAREKWWIHWNPRTQMREKLAKLKRYTATPRVAKHRVFVWLGSVILPDAQLVVFAREDDYFIGVLQSWTHELWARRMGTQLRDAESGFRYTSTTCFETFPFPWPPDREPKEDARVQAIAQAAKELVEQRDAWLNPAGAGDAELKKRTLTNLYNAKPQWLLNAHRKLDEAVFAAYGWPGTLSDDEILARLLALNLERAGKGRGV